MAGRSSEEEEGQGRKKKKIETVARFLKREKGLGLWADHTQTRSPRGLDEIGNASRDL